MISLRSQYGNCHGSKSDFSELREFLVCFAVNIYSHIALQKDYFLTLFEFTLRNFCDFKYTKTLISNYSLTTIM